MMRLILVYWYPFCVQHLVSYFFLEYSIFVFFLSGNDIIKAVLLDKLPHDIGVLSWCRERDKLEPKGLLKQK